MIARLRGFVVTASLIIAASFLSAAPPRIAVGDFTVTSDNPKLKYVGKGLAEMVAAQLATSKLVVLIDREKRDAVLGEQEYSLSALADVNAQVEAGKLLAADFLLFGEIIDMDSSVLVSCKMVKVETGEVAWNDKNLGPLADYDGISRKMAASALKGLGVEKAAIAAAAPPKASPEISAERKVEAVIAFSSAVEALDKKDSVEAKRQIELASAIDPRNAAVASYLAKLITNTTKFNLLIEPYYTYMNPAFLGIMRTDMLFLSASNVIAPIFYSPPIEGLNYASIKGDSHITENEGGSRVGYATPIGKSFGMRAEAVFGEFDNRGYAHKAVSTGDSGSGMSARSICGAILDFGWAPSSSLSLGAGMGVMAHSKQNSDPTAFIRQYSGLIYNADLGFLVRNENESLVFDSRIGYTTETNGDFDPVSLTVTGTETAVPLFIENTLTAALGEKRENFFIVKQADKIFYDGSTYFGTILPAAEHFFGKALSLRLGVEGSLLLSDGSTTFGYGGLGGVTIRIIPWGMDLDLNVSYRMRPSRIVSGVLYPDFLMLVNVDWNGVFKKSR